MADQDRAQIIITAERAKGALDNAAAQAIQTQNPEMYHKMVQSLIVTAYTRVDELQMALVQIGKAARFLAAEVRELRGGDGGATGATAVAPTEETPPPSSHAVDTEVPTVSASGEPLSAEEQAREAAMNAAIAAAEAEKNGGAPPARQMVARGRAGRPGQNGPQRRRPAAPPVAAGDMDNLPEDPEARQAALNAIMDAASTETTS